MASIWDLIKGAGEGLAGLAQGYADANPYMPSSSRSDASRRQSTADALRERLFNERQQQQQQQFQQRQQQLDQRQKDLEQQRQQLQENAAAKEKLAEQKQGFDQSVTAGDLFSKNWDVAQPGPPSNVQVTVPGATPGEVNALPPAEREFATTTPYSQTVQVPSPLDTKGRPSITAGGATLIPKSPEEMTQQGIASKRAETKAALDDFHQEFQNYMKDPANADYAKTHPDVINDMMFSKTFGFTPKPETTDQVLAEALRKGLAGDSNAMDMFNKGMAAKKGTGELPADIKLRDPNLPLTTRDWGVLEGESNEVKALAHGMVDYAAPMPSGMAMRDPKSLWNRVAALAMQIDPSFDAKVYKTRQDVMRSFSSGKDSTTVTSIRQLVGHLGEFADAAKALDNGDVHGLNYVKNAAKSNIGGFPEKSAFWNAATAVETELASVFKQSGAPTDQETREWRKGLNENLTPAEYKASAQSAIKLMLTRAAAQQDKWETSMGAPMKVPLFSPQTAAAIDKLMDVPGYTKKFMDGSSRFGDSGMAVAAATPAAASSAPAESKQVRLKIVTPKGVAFKTFNAGDPDIDRFKKEHGAQEVPLQ